MFDRAETKLGVAIAVIVAVAIYFTGIIGSAYALAWSSHKMVILFCGAGACEEPAVWLAYLTTFCCAAFLVWAIHDRVINKEWFFQKPVDEGN